MDTTTVVETLIAHLHRLDIRLWIEGSRLCYDAPKGRLTADLRAQLREHKVALMALSRDHPADGYGLEPVEPAPRHGDFPASAAQGHFWLYQKLHPTDCIYNISYSFRLIGKLDAAALKHSFDAIIRRHEILRTTFQEVNGFLRQVIAPPSPITMPVLPWQHVPEQEQPGAVEKWAVAETQRPFDLSTGPLLRVTLLQLAAETYILLVYAHHIIVDDWSLGILFKELSVLYAAFVAGTPSRLPTLPMQYSDYTLQQRQSLTPEGMETRLAYWRQWLAEEPPLLELPSHRPPVQNFRAGLEWYHIAPDLTQQLINLSRQTATTLFMISLAALGALLSSYSGYERIGVGAPFANRNRRELEPLIGCIGSILALYVDLRGQPNFLELLARVRRMMLAAMANQDVPFAQFVTTLLPDRNLRQRPLFRVIISYLTESPRRQLTLPGLTVSLLPKEEVQVRPDLGLIIWEEETPSGPSLQGWWQYQKDLFATETIAQLARDFQTLLAAIVAHPQRTVGKLCIT